MLGSVEGLPLMQPRTLLVFFAAMAHWWIMSTSVSVSGPSLQSYLPVGWLPAYLSLGGNCSPFTGLALFELDEIHVGQPLQSVEVPWVASQTSGESSTSPIFFAICKLTECALYYIVQIVNKVFKHHWAQYWPLGYSVHYWPPARSTSLSAHSATIKQFLIAL